MVILQDERFDAIDSITFCPLTTEPIDVPSVRPMVEPNERNGLRKPSRLMADKIMTVPKSKLGGYLGRLDRDDIVRLNRAVMMFLGLAETDTR